jgi:hypothetical protein
VLALAGVVLGIDHRPIASVLPLVLQVLPLVLQVLPRFHL